MRRCSQSPEAWDASVRLLHADGRRSRLSSVSCASVLPQPWRYRLFGFAVHIPCHARPVTGFHIAIPAVNGSGEDARALVVPVPSRRGGVAVVTGLASGTGTANTVHRASTCTWTLQSSTSR
jgi:hypothetical protein